MVTATATATNDNWETTRTSTAIHTVASRQMATLFCSLRFWRALDSSCCALAAVVVVVVTVAAAAAVAAAF